MYNNQAPNEQPIRVLNRHDRFQVNNKNMKTFKPDWLFFFPFWISQLLLVLCFQKAPFSIFYILIYFWVGVLGPLAGKKNLQIVKGKARWRPLDKVGSVRRQVTQDMWPGHSSGRHQAERRRCDSSASSWTVSSTLMPWAQNVHLNDSIILGHLLCAAFISWGTCFLRSGVKSSLFFILLPWESSPVSLGVGGFCL